MNPVVKDEPIPPDVLAAWQATNKITTEAVKHENGSGGFWTERGSKKILINGEHWATIRMEGHGVHGPSFQIKDANGRYVYPEYKPVKGRKGITLPKPFTTWTPRRWDEEKRSAAQQMMDLIPSLVMRGYLRDPKIIAEQNERAEKRRAEARAVELETNARRIAAAVALWRRNDLTEDQREVISFMFKDCYHGPIEKEAGK